MTRSVPCPTCAICLKQIVTTKNLKYHPECRLKTASARRAEERRLLGRGPGCRLVAGLLKRCGEAIRAGRLEPMQ